MIERWSRDQVLSLAPDAPSRQAAQTAAAPEKWPVRGVTGVLLFGECLGGGTTPYRTRVDLREPAYRCPCPSRKSPCDHALGLLLLWSAYDVPPANTPPPWATERLTQPLPANPHSTPDPYASHLSAPALPEAARPALTRLDLVRPDVPGAEVARPDLTRPALTRLDLVRPDVPGAEVARPDLTRPALTRPDLTRPAPDLGHPDLSGPDLPGSGLSEQERPRPGLVGGATGSGGLLSGGGGGTDSGGLQPAGGGGNGGGRGSYGQMREAPGTPAGAESPPRGTPARGDSGSDAYGRVGEASGVSVRRDSAGRVRDASGVSVRRDSAGRVRDASGASARRGSAGRIRDASGTLARGGSGPREGESPRHGRVAAGLAELERWLADQMRQGLAAAAPADWEGLAKRLVDAQAPGVAGLVTRLARVREEDEWPARLLEEYALLHLLAVAYRERAGLPRELAETVLMRVGFPVTREAVLLRPPVRDRWDVLGGRDEEQDRLTARRVWLRGRETGRPALILSFAPHGQPLDASLVTGTTIDADLAFYPGAAPLRALVARRHPSLPASPQGSAELATSTPPRAGRPPANPPSPTDTRLPPVTDTPMVAAGPSPTDPRLPPVTDATAAAGMPSPEDGEDASWGPPPGMSADDAMEEVAAALAADPWTESWPLVLTPVVPEETTLAGFPLLASWRGVWRLLAVSGGRPLTVAAEWTPRGLRPLTTWDEDETAVVL